MARKRKYRGYIANFLIPKIPKRWAYEVFKEREGEWRLYAEGCLRNRRFHEAIFERGSKCLVCDKPILGKDGKRVKQCDKHHNDYLRLCIGWPLDEGHNDEIRPIEGREFYQVPDCASCEEQDPEYFAGCVNKVFPVHRHCHGRIHEVEKQLREGQHAAYKQAFTLAALGYRAKD